MFQRNEIDDPFRLLDEIRREVDRYYEGQGNRTARNRQWSGARLEDNGGAFLLSVDLPGVKESDVDLSLENQTLTLTVERKADVPQGYAMHRQERAPFRLSRSFALGARVNPEKVRASMTNGVLTVQIEKAPEFQPRKIAIGKA